MKQLKDLLKSDSDKIFYCTYKKVKLTKKTQYHVVIGNGDVRESIKNICDAKCVNR